MDATELLRLITKGEDSFHQFKETITHPETLAKEMVAYSNSEGGIVLIGVTDKDEIKGLNLNDVQDLNKHISSAATDYVRPPIAPITENIRLAGGIVIVLKIDKGNAKPFRDKSGHVYVKNGIHRRKLTASEEFLKGYQESNLMHADTSKVSGSSLVDLDREYFATFFKKLYDEKIEDQSIPLPKILENMNLSKDGKLNYTGLLLLGLRPEYKLPAFIVKAVSFPGINIEDVNYIDGKDIKGKLSDIFQQVMSFILSNIRHVQNNQGFNSVSEPEIPRFVLEELVVNALIHRNYSISAPVQVLIFYDRIEIISPGLLPNNLNIENIKMGNFKFRNPTLVSYASKILPYNGPGTGIMRALKSYPEIEFDNNYDLNSFRVEIKRKNIQS